MTKVATLKVELGTVEEPRLSHIVSLRGDELLRLAERFCRLVDITQAQSSLRTGQMIVGAQHVGVTLGYLEVDDILVDELLPLYRQLIEFLVVLLVVQQVAVIAVDIRNGRWRRFHLLEQIEALAVGGGTLVEVMHVGIDVTHNVISHRNTILVVVELGVVHHRLHLAKGHVTLLAEGERVDLIAPYLVHAVVHLQVAQTVNINGDIAEQRVLHVLVIEEDDARQGTRRIELFLALLVALVDEVADATGTVGIIVGVDTELLQLVEHLQARSTMHAGQHLAQLLHPTLRLERHQDASQEQQNGQ